MANKFWRTVIEVEILSDGEEPPPLMEHMGIYGIAYEITDGEWSGSIKVKKQKEVTPKRMAKLLMKQGSDPGFLRLDKNGNLAEESNDI